MSDDRANGTSNEMAPHLSEEARPVEPTDLLDAWSTLTDAQRELLIPRLLRDTDLGRKIGATAVPWRPQYDK